MTDIETDILVVGAGPVGMTLALAIRASGVPLKVKLLDSRKRGNYASDPRALALSHGTRQLLEPMNAWNAAAGTSIHGIHVSQSGSFGRTLITREEMCVPALGYVMRYGDLAAAIAGKLDASDIIDECRLVDTTLRRDHVLATVQRDEQIVTLRAGLIVHAEGTPADSADIRVFDYGQRAVLAEVRPYSTHANRAWERFTPDGPLALLPFGEDYSVVFTVPPHKADALMEMDDTAFLAALQRQFGSRLKFTSTSQRACFPLALRLRREIIAERAVWIGNAAQTLHPVSGQGFNLGIRDAIELAECILSTPGDIGNRNALEDLEKKRRLDRWGSAGFTDGIVRIFSNDLPPLRWARGAGLAALDAVPSLRRLVAGRMIWGPRAWH